MGSICWENPHFIDNILAGSGPLLELLFQLITNAATLPNNINALIHVLNFLHSVSLKEGPVRDQRLPKLLPAFLHQVFTHDKFYDCLESKKLTSLFSALLKFHANVKHVDKYLYNALIRSITHVNSVYKAFDRSPPP